ncbi:cellulose synthase-like protein E6 isoform X2 [Malania oleifera]|uniref:cellulose synthase-like protein E6 isoform X2 n=1 Tax=Malania oleifera TaxID=397392 RepID=UPI0025AE330C|nr:cellulose synthase-like protein E6 isoform X2 [Malania oleifera]
MGRGDEYVPLFETKEAKGRIPYRLYAASVFVGICMIWVYRVSHLPAAEEQVLERWVWVGAFLAELWFSFYWLITQFVRWNPIFRSTFKDRLSHRYAEDLPGIDIFVCTADPRIEPPTMVINTVLSTMAYNYPPEKLSIYLSDDGGSELTFYALLEASRFAKEWLPFCKKFKVEPRCPEAYFSFVSVDHTLQATPEWSSIKRSYEDMKNRINTTEKLGHISEEIRKEHKGFRDWALVSNRHDHPTILQIIIDGRNRKTVDVEGQPLPTLIYLAREKRPKYHHNFKAGAMNALIRVSSRLSNNPIILNLDCDMYSNNSETVRDALCFFMDEEKGHEIAYVQYPQKFNNITNNDIYSNSFRVINEVELPGFDSNGGPCYIGTGCFHRREALCGMKHGQEYEVEWKRENDKQAEGSSCVLEETCKVLASCTYEENTQWGKEMGLKYGCPVEDVLTGLIIQCRGWKSIYFNPERAGFLGVGNATLLQVLVQHKRWSEGDFQIFLSRYCCFMNGPKISLKLQVSYCVYLLWAPNSLAALYYVLVLPLCLLKATPLFPKISSPWVLPFAYVILAAHGYSLGEFMWCGGTLRGWWNDQRVWMFKRTTSYFFGFMDNILKLLGFNKPAFSVTPKSVDDHVSQRYEQEVMEFGTSSPMFIILATLALINLFAFAGGVKMVIMNEQTNGLEALALQILLSGLVAFINLPIYQGLFFRLDNGRMPASVTYQSVALALFVCSVALY